MSKYIYLKESNEVQDESGNRYKVTGTHSWSDQQVLEENKDFILRLQYLSYDEKTWVYANGRTESELHYIKRPYRKAAVPINQD